MALRAGVRPRSLPARPDLLNHSPVFGCQRWALIHIKNGETMPTASAVKAVRFFVKRDGLPMGAP